VRSEVTNIRELYKNQLTTDDFADHLFNFIVHSLSPASPYHWSRRELERISEIKENRYLNPDWTYNYSPDYLFENEFQVSDEHIRIKLKVSRGSIGTLEITGPGELKDQLDEIANILLGIRHERKSVEDRLKSSIFVPGKAGKLIDVLLDNMF
jgi:lipoate-protein ligase A